MRGRRNWTQISSSLMECGQVVNIRHWNDGLLVWCTAFYDDTTLSVPPPSTHTHTHTHTHAHSCTLTHTHTHTDPCQVELRVVMRYPTDIAEDSCFPLCTSLQKSLTGSKTGRGKNIYHGGHMHTASNPIHSNPEDSFDHERSVLAISDVVRVNLHPQLSSSKSFNVFS